MRLWPMENACNLWNRSLWKDKGWHFHQVNLRKDYVKIQNFSKFDMYVSRLARMKDTKSGNKGKPIWTAGLTSDEQITLSVQG